MHAEGGPSAAPRSRMNGVARQQGQRYAMTLPLMAPGILAGAVTAFAAGLGEFGAVITFASSIPGQTQTLPPATRAAIQAPGGEATAAKLSLVSFTLAVAGLGRHTQEASGLLNVAIVGGAVVPLLFGVVADASTLRVAFVLPVLCYAYIMWYGLRGHVQPATA